MIRILQAITSLARDPFPFLLTVLGCRFLHQHGWGWVGWIVATGFCVSVFQSALKSDSAPPPRSKELPRTAYLGCLGGCGLWAAVLFANIVLGCGAALLGLNGTRYMVDVWHHPLSSLVWYGLIVWLTQTCFAALLLACSSVRGQQGAPRIFGGFFHYCGRMLVRPPLNGAGLRLTFLAAAILVSAPALEIEDNTLLQCSPLLLTTLYAHCLGQYVRKGHGFRVS